MSRIPAEEQLDLVQGSTFDETWEFYDDDEQSEPTDFTNIVVTLRIARDSTESPLITLSSVGKVTAPTDGNGLYIVDGTIRIYIRDETTALLTESQFRQVSDCDGESPYRGLNTLIFTPTDGQATVENVGAVTFTPIVEPS